MNQDNHLFGSNLLNNNPPKVSVHVVTYNQVSFIKETLESILVQGYPNMEVIIGDDCSTDGTQEILKGYRDRYPNLIKLILSEKNSGVTENCNRVFKHCNGKYVALLAGDDVWLPGKIHKQVAYMEQNPKVVLCYTHVDVFDNTSGKTLWIAPHKKIKKTVRRDLLDITMKLGANGTSFMVRSSAIPVEGFDQNIPTVSDWLFWVDVLSKGEVGCVNEVLSRYRRHDSNLSSDSNLICSEHLITLKYILKKHPNQILSVLKMWLRIMLNRIFRYIMASRISHIP